MNNGTAAIVMLSGRVSINSLIVRILILKIFTIVQRREIFVFTKKIKKISFGSDDRYLLISDSINLARELFLRFFDFCKSNTVQYLLNLYIAKLLHY